jgi:hypothetical protein
MRCFNSQCPIRSRHLVQGISLILWVCLVYRLWGSDLKKSATCCWSKLNFAIGIKPNSYLLQCKINPQNIVIYPITKITYFQTTKRLNLNNYNLNQIVNYWKHQENETVVCDIRLLHGDDTCSMVTPKCSYIPFPGKEDKKAPVDGADRWRSNNRENLRTPFTADHI